MNSRVSLLGTLGVMLATSVALVPEARISRRIASSLGCDGIFAQAAGRANISDAYDRLSEFSKRQRFWAKKLGEGDPLRQMRNVKFEFVAEPGRLEEIRSRLVALGLQVESAKVLEPFMAEADGKMLLVFEMGGKAESVRAAYDELNPSYIEPYFQGPQDPRESDRLHEANCRFAGAAHPIRERGVTLNVAIEFKGNYSVEELKSKLMRANSGFGMELWRIERNAEGGTLFMGVTPTTQDFQALDAEVFTRFDLVSADLAQPIVWPWSRYEENVFSVSGMRAWQDAKDAARSDPHHLLTLRLTLNWYYGVKEYRAELLEIERQGLSPLETRMQQPDGIATVVVIGTPDELQKIIDRRAFGHAELIP